MLLIKILCGRVAHVGRVVAIIVAIAQPPASTLHIGVNLMKQESIDAMIEESKYSSWKANSPVTYSSLYYVLKGLGLIDKDMSCEEFMNWTDSLN